MVWGRYGNGAKMVLGWYNDGTRMVGGWYGALLRWELVVR
jgi:hypothetical protein